MATEHCRKRRRIDDDSEEEAVNPKTSPISKLGDDVLAEVLIRAPEPGSAWRSKAVCKRWNSLISDPQFARRFISHHHYQSSEEPPLISRWSWRSISSFLPYPEEIGFGIADLKIFDCYKDLVLCGFPEGVPLLHPEFGRSLFLCNPFTKQWIALPLAPPRVPSAFGTREPRLVCEPRDRSSSVELDLGEGRPPFIYSSAYRFRVVCIYDLPEGARIDVFCSESGEWTKGALVIDGEPNWVHVDVVSTGNMVWFCLELHLKPWKIVGFNPFRLDISTIRVDVSQLRRKGNWNISVSRGALHLISLEAVSGVPAFLSVSRLEEDRKSWSIQHKTLFKCDGYEIKDCNVVALHPEKPHIVFFESGTVGHDYTRSVVLSYDMNTGELQYFSKFLSWWMVFQPRVSCWPTPISRYEELRGIYDGRHSCWVQQSSSSKAATLSLNNCGRVVKRRIMQWLDRCSGWFNH